MRSLIYVFLGFVASILFSRFFAVPLWLELMIVLSLGTLLYILERENK